MGQNLNSADAFFAVVIARIEGLGDDDLLNSLFDRSKGTREWWNYFKQQDEAQVLFESNSKLKLAFAMIMSGKPLKLIGSKLGLYRPDKLPHDIEVDVQAELKSLEEAYLELISSYKLLLYMFKLVLKRYVVDND